MSSGESSYSSGSSSRTESGGIDSDLFLDLGLGSGLPSSTLSQIGSFGADYDFLQEVDFSQLEYHPLTPETYVANDDLAGESLRIGTELLGSVVTYNYRSVYVGKPFDVAGMKARLSLGLGYEVKVPEPRDHTWMMREPGWHGIPILWFQLGFQLPPHSFFLTLYRALGCGIGQLSPNTLIQVSGVIARCCEMGIEPSLEILFSIYWLESSSGQLYLGKCKGRVHLVHAPSSNSKYHHDWLYFKGPALDKVGPWREVSEGVIYELNRLPKKQADFLITFHGKKIKFFPKNFDNPRFLSEHALLGGDLAGSLGRDERMIPDSTFARLTKRAQSSHALGRQGREGELGGSEVSRPRRGESLNTGDTVCDDIEIIGENRTDCFVPRCIQKGGLNVY